jgi:hypothetical protein
MTERNSCSAEPLASAEQPRQVNGTGASKNLHMDEARITAGIVDLYKEMLQEPVPEEWLRLIKGSEIEEQK